MKSVWLFQLVGFTLLYSGRLSSSCVAGTRSFEVYRKSPCSYAARKLGAQRT